MEDIEKTYPKVLIINSQSINMNQPTGITLRSFFANWPKDRIFEIYHWKALSYTQDILSIPSEQIPTKAMPLYFYFRKLMKKECAYESPADAGATAIAANSKGNIKTAVKDLTKMISELTPIVFKDKKFLKKIDDFSPDVIYTYGGSVYINRFALFFARRYKINIVTHYMDNWRQTDFMDNPYTKVLNSILNRSVKKIEKKMKKGLTISEKMAENYKAEYKADYAAIMNCVDFPKDRKSVVYEEKKIIKFIYAGGLPIGRHEQLIIVQNSILKFNSEQTANSALLVIYTSDRDRASYAPLFDATITEFRNYLPHSQVHKIYEESDVLVYTESFEKSMVEYTKYSMSTKIPEYMSSGKPILCYAPENIAVSEYIEATQTGICATNKGELDAAIKTLTTSHEVRKTLGQNGIATAKENHSQNRAESVLLEVLTYNAKVAGSY